MEKANLEEQGGVRNRVGTKPRGGGILTKLLEKDGSRRKADLKRKTWSCPPAGGGGGI